ncbi:exp1-like protein [Mortierella sp. NVP85]|nr:exp1-like protein [Mortierella sp. NVP85]
MPKDPTAKVAKPQKKAPVVDMPKRPGTSWNMFFREHMEKVKASGKPVVPTVEGAIAADLWKNLSPTEKKAVDVNTWNVQVYQDKYKSSFEEFKKETKERLQQMTPAEYKQENDRRRALREAGRKGFPPLKDPNAPKRPLSNFFLFARDLRLSRNYAHLTLKEQSKAFADAWAALPEDKKAVYTEKNRVEMEIYKTEMAAYSALAS